GIEILTGVKAGQLRNDGTYDPGTVHYKVNKRLGEMSQRMIALRGLLGLEEETSRSEVEALAQPRSKP
ncbi:MAG TPA: hypothetical protein VNA15_12225, partial [Candidatus Angelobacter sp.]|nr:hypothetical protein [Candidatus Angelobacter sp.]